MSNNISQAFTDVDIEEVQSYWDSRPCNIRHSPKEIGTKEYFDEVEARKYFVEPHIPAFAEFEKWKGKKVLEIGCGIGTDTINFARAGAQVTAVDLSEKSLEIAQKRARLFGYDIKFYQANAEELSRWLPLEEYDLIYSFGVIHHTPHPEQAISEIRKYMGLNSVFKMMVYHRYSWKVLWILLVYGKGQFWKLDELIARYSEAQTGCPVTYTYTKESVKELLKHFKIIKVQVEHIFPYRISDYINYNYVKAWYFRWMPKRMFRWMEKNWGWHLCVTAKLKK
ncbi:type 12 methyltransferase [Candidatus Desulfofervidus auxilii]|uniref:Type 12 methyltransferase n=1 Tax=Desulfofervidus auxilii TaxID=1621989 RepID=A0A7U4QJH0_DESA2|nr:class I SAM-dependent methyltransferase [Candidatus Desulfofervidus auxilii]AMM40507.1 type 12 methyltransferase [Candidatus Desulfofervidus auxilii]CAD7774222.1 Ubiquinone biosynthesis O-methyltransferase [Candidatus Methanoperedenaceae archaeon GB37]